MAGGKETPRQKMIGMMYLVLTALLALNVSKAILDAFVAIEENIQISNLNEYGRGEEKRSDLEEVAQDKSAPDLQKKAKMLMTYVDKIDKMTAVQIKFIDDLKLDVLERCGENVQETGEENIVTIPYSTKEPLRPTRMNLMKVDGKDKYDEPMQALGIADDVKNPTGKGKELWDNYLKFRKELTELIASSSSSPEKKFSFKDPNILKFKDFKDLAAQLDKHMKNVSPDDNEALKKIYSSLSKVERADMHEGEIKDVHWIGRTFDHSPSVAAIASLSSLQKEILTARADAVALIRSRVGGGEYSFNKIMPLAYGPDIANNGDEVVVEVLMAAYDSDKQPEVTYGGSKVSEVKDGKGYVRTKANGSSEMVLGGNITIKNKSGIPKTMPWQKTIKIMKPEGTVSLPEMNMLYRGYDNKVEGVASGYDQTILSGSNVTLSKAGKGYIGRPGSGKSCSITISGKNSVTNKTVSLGVFTFRVSNLPPAQVYFGNAANGMQGSKFETKIFTRYPPEIPLDVKFTTLSWEMEFMGRQVRGTGGTLDANAVALLKQAKPGANVSFIVKYKGPDNVQRTGVCVVKL